MRRNFKTRARPRISGSIADMPRAPGFATMARPFPLSAPTSRGRPGHRVRLTTSVVGNWSRERPTCSWRKFGCEMKTTNTHGELTIDHSNSPGISQAEADHIFKASGNIVPVVPEGETLHLKTKSCAHCGGCVVLNPLRIRERGRCFNCFKYLCDGCAVVPHCRPIQALADAVAGSDKPLSQNLILRSR